MKRRYLRVPADVRAMFAADLSRRYAAGESIRGLAKATGYSYGTVHRLLEEAGAELRHQGSRRPAVVPDVPGAALVEGIHHYLNGLIGFEGPAAPARIPDRPDPGV